MVTAFRTGSYGPKGCIVVVYGMFGMPEGVLCGRSSFEGLNGNTSTIYMLGFKQHEIILLLKHYFESM